MAAEHVPTVHLKKGSAKPLHGGHPWVFADAIASVDGTPQAGDEVRIVDANGGCLGRGFYSPKSAIAVRLITRADVEITTAFLETRILEALRLRREILSLGVGASVTAGVPAISGRALTETEAAQVSSIDQQILRVQAFAAQYGMDASEETSELRRKRDAILAGKPLEVPAPPLPPARDEPAKTIGPAPTEPNPSPSPIPQGEGEPNSARFEPPPTTAYRLINSEGDGLGGLTVDVYGDYLSVQIGTAGMERRLDAILDILQRHLRPLAILDRSDKRARKLEELPPPREAPLRGTSPQDLITVRENGIAFRVDVRPGHGQKTGMFIDQRENRRRFGEFASGRDVLDVFSYSGGFSLYAAHAGARSLTLLDSSEEALNLAKANLGANNIDDADLVCAEWAEGFKHLREAGRQFSLMVVDPPKFSRAREQASQALSGYRDLNAQAVRLLAPGGILFTCSCSGTVSETEFERAVASGIRSAGRRAVLLERRGAASDHPVPPGFEQGRYLKCLVLQVV
ncbi:MAG TPA: class I SAM-dependent methyltransferase [Planctomycetota bacterium]|nr:class I SAM-dependent methyltransferase [Planctomycetota bacterium]